MGRTKAGAQTEADASQGEVLRALYGDNLPAGYAATVELAQTILKTTALYDRFAKQHALNANSLMVLMVLHYSAEPRNQRFISDALSLPKQTVGSIFLKRKEAGYLAEKPSPEDARAKDIILTEQGARFCDEVFEELRALESRAFQTVDVAEIEAAARSMRAFIDAFDAGLDEAAASERR